MNMIFRQLFDASSSTYSYLLADTQTHEAVLIDPVKDQLAQYLQLLDELNIQLLHALDTHTHADHVTALGALREATQCTTLMGDKTQAKCVSRTLQDGECVRFGEHTLKALYTPGHTSDSFSYLLNDDQAVFTGDVLLIRGSGRTDFQGGDPELSWDSIVNTLFALPEQTAVYPAHDYKGWTQSTIGEEKRHNPRLAGKSRAEYIAIMQALDLPDPAMMDIAVPANLACGQP